MRVLKNFSFLAAAVATLGLSTFAGVSAAAQSAKAVAASARIAQTVDVADRTELPGTVPVWATPAADQGALASSRRLDNLHLVLARAPQVQAAFEQLLKDQQDPSSPRYHQWLTPQQNAEQFGIAPSDLAAVTTWLQEQGLSVDDVAAGGVFITFSGPVSAVENAFSTSLHNFAQATRNGVETHYAPTTEPKLPTAIAGVITGITGLAEMQFRSFAHSPGKQPLASVYPDASSNNSQLKPNYTLGSGAYHFLSPGDFTLIYDLAPVYSAGITGTGSRVAILGGSRVLPADVTNYETLFGLSAIAQTTVIPPTGTDPGYTNDDNQGEATLDVDRVIATAPSAGPDLLIMKNALSFANTFTLLQYNISTLNDPVQSLSFGACENGSSYYALQYDTYFKTAAAQGIGTYVSSGDNGAAGCDAQYSSIPATQIASANLICASSYATCVGGTEFADFASPSTYWSSTNSSTKVSALGYIPEGAWNEPTYTNSSGGTSYQAIGTGGGVSVAVTKPTWQTGTGVPADGYRDSPDVSFAGSTHNSYVLCVAYAGADCTQYVYPVGGTSASAPSMAGVAALLNQKLGARQGNINPLMYRLAVNTASGAFHDVTPATSGVATCTTATPSMCNNSTPSSTGLTGGLAGYALTTGYDQSTGLGTLDVSKFFIAAASPYVTSTLALTATPNPINAGSSSTITATITPASLPATPTGTVQFYSNGTALGSPVTIVAGTVSGTYTAALTQSFATAGSYTITATYSGDNTYIGTSGTGAGASLTLVVNSIANFSITPGVTALTLNSGATTGNTVSYAVTSTNSFAGTVGLTCAVTNVSGTAAGTCALAPTSVALTANGTLSSTLTLTTTPGTKGTLAVVVTGTSGAVVVTAATVNVTLNAAALTVVAAPATLTLVSGATTGNTSTVTVGSTNSFAGVVTLTCASVNTSGTSAGSCTVSPATVTLTSGSTAPATVTQLSTPGTAGTLTSTITATGTTTNSSLSTSTSATLVSTLTSSSFTVSASPTALTLNSGATTGNTSAITVTSVNGFAGTVNLGCAAVNLSGAANASCSVSPSTVTLIAGGTASATATITTAYGAGGTLTATVTGTGTPAGGTLSSTANASVAVTVTAPSFSLSTPGALSLTSGATTGNTAAVTITSNNTFAGTVNFNCSLSSSSAVYPPTCAVTPSTGVVLTSGGTGTATVTITTTTPHAVNGGLQSMLRRSNLPATGAVFAAMLLLLPFRRKRSLARLLAVAFAVLVGLSAMTGCGGGGTAPKTLGSSAGTYTVTVTGTGTATGSSTAVTTTTSFALTVN
jgi:subtilase family serine protease